MTFDPPASTGDAVSADQPFVVSGRRLHRPASDEDWQLHDAYFRAADAQTNAERQVARMAIDIADAWSGGWIDGLYMDEATNYPKVKAGLTYAQAVYEVEAEKIRAAR